MKRWHACETERRLLLPFQQNILYHPVTSPRSARSESFPSFKVLPLRRNPWEEKRALTQPLRRKPPEEQCLSAGGGVRGKAGRTSLRNIAGDLQQKMPSDSFLDFIFVIFHFTFSNSCLPEEVSHDKMCTKRMARPMLSRITMQIMMVFGPWRT